MTFQLTTQTGVRISYARCDGLMKFSSIVEGEQQRPEHAPVVSVSKDIENILRSEARIASRIKVVMANDGAVALPMVRGHDSLSILILDLALPQARQWIRATAPDGQVPLVLSGPELTRATYVRLEDPDALMRIVNSRLRPLDADDLTDVVMGLSRVVDDPGNLRELEIVPGELKEVVFTLFSPRKSESALWDIPPGAAVH